MADAVHERRVDTFQGPYAGRHVGRYRLITEVAQGGMASVYLALDVQSDARLAAVKIIREDLTSDAELVRMFFDEACIASQIVHPNTARVLAFGSEDSLHYLAMDYLLGETWQQVLRQAAGTRVTGVRTKLPLLVAHVLREVAQGLHAAHEARDAQGNALKVVHRDVSPQNIMVGYDGQVHVLDFGIAKVGNRISNTGPDAVKGRFAYMAPEQMRGLLVDRRADLWSLGVLLWEGLTCRRLFRRDSDAETIMASAYATIPRATQVNPAAPHALSDLAESLLQRDRAKRPETALVVAEQLERYLRVEGVRLTSDTLQRQMRYLFGARGEQKRNMLVRLRRRFSRPVGVHVLLPDDTPSAPQPGLQKAPTAPRNSGVRPRRWQRVATPQPRAAAPATFSEFPTVPRLQALREADPEPGIPRAVAWLGLALGAAAGLGALAWLIG